MSRILRQWVWVAPALGWLILAVGGAAPVPLVGLALIGSVLAAVHHAEVVAHRVGEPFGTLLLAIAVTVIEVGLILTLMSAAGPDAATLARDTVFAAVMIILGGLLGGCLLVGGLVHGEQSFRQTGVSASLAALGALTVLTLVLPNFTVSAPGPVYSPSQLAFVAVVSFLLYLTFVAVQTVRHRDYFLPKEAAVLTDEEAHAAPPTMPRTLFSGGLLLACLAAVVLLAKALAPTIEAAVAAADAPRAAVGVVIAALVLLPESVAAIRAARANRLQTSLNLALGSALATIGLTIPAVAALSLAVQLPIALGLDGKGTVLLFLILLVSTLSLGTGRTTILQGAVHLTIFAVYLFTTVVP
jgi:Ca2+:H+ antiporter